MQAKELFIYNETYPLPLDKYADFKSRRDGCAGNPMCINRLKFDAETFIADFGKKHGSKIETGEESGYTVLKEDSESKLPLPKAKESSLSKIKSIKNIELIAIGILVILGTYAFVKKSMMVGTITIIAIMCLPFLLPPKEKEKSLD